jgi:drug/metabolite transporter (DMT)-like permease
MKEASMANATLAPSAEPRWSRAVTVGVGLALVTVVIWSLWFVTTRQAATVHLPPAWLGLCRFVPPAFALLPFWWKVGLLPRGVDRRIIAAMVVGAGAPFFLIAATGMHFASTGESGVLLGGTMPFFVALLSAAIDRERFSPVRLLGFAAVLAALILIGGSAVVGGEGLGRFLLPLGGFLWAVYTLAFRRSGVSAIAAAGIIAAWSSIMLLPVALLDGMEAVRAAGLATLIGQVLSQGVLSGIVALVCYGGAVARLGASRSAIFAALPPAIAAVIAIPLLGEIPRPLVSVGIVLAVVGVTIGSGALGLRRG